MKISGFTFGKNVSKLYYPIKPAIESILPIVDEMIIALGKGDDDDNTLELINSIQSPKIKIIHTEWDIKKYPTGMENAHQTDIAKQACTGDWCLYVQADEVIHEKYLPVIKENCERYLNNKKVDGFLFKYLHFYADYDHYNNAHGWYPREIRLVRNDKDIHSWQSAQSFRRIANFDGLSYRTVLGTSMLNVVEIEAYIYHYGWVRPPKLMHAKSKALATVHKGEAKATEIYGKEEVVFDYGNLSKLPVFKGTHPAVMKDFIDKFDWANQLNFDKNHKPNRTKMKHEKWKSITQTFFEQKLLNGKQPLGYSNWKIIKP